MAKTYERVYENLLRQSTTADLRAASLHGRLPHLQPATPAKLAFAGAAAR
jgi:hypothetical protein